MAAVDVSGALPSEALTGLVNQLTTCQDATQSTVDNVIVKIDEAIGRPQAINADLEKTLKDHVQPLLDLDLKQAVINMKHVKLDLSRISTRGLMRQWNW